MKFMSDSEFQDFVAECQADRSWGSPVATVEAIEADWAEVGRMLTQSQRDAAVLAVDAVTVAAEERV